MSSAVDELLASLDVEPSLAVRRLGDALASDAAQEVRTALREDQRFGPPLQAICRDVEALDEMRYLVQYLGALNFKPAVPELINVWRANRRGLSDQAGEALLAMGDEASVRAMADDLPTVKDRQITVATRAVFALGPTEAYERLSPQLDLNKPRAAAVLGALTPEQLTAEPRWTALAVRAVREGDRFARAAAGRALQRGLDPDDLDSLFPPEEAPEMTNEMKAARVQQLEKGRTRMGKLRDALPPDFWQAPRRSRKAQLTRLEKRLGPLPPCVRAFYELMDGISVPAQNGNKPFIVYPLGQAVKEAKAWKRSGPPALVPPFIFPVAPDAYTLAGLSGGPDVGFEMPCDDADPRLMNMSRPPRFGAFVRRALKA